MASLEELRKLKGYEPLFLPFLYDVLIPDDETTRIQRDQRKLVSKLTQNKQITNSYSEELLIVDNLLENKIINSEANEKIYY
jgi:hypothetical protein